MPGTKPTTGNQREPTVVSLSDCSWDSDGPSHDPGHSRRDQEGLEPGVKQIERQTAEDPELGVRIRARQAPARRQEAAQSSPQGGSEDESPAAYAMPQRPARRGRLVQVVDSQTPQRPRPAAATPTLESGASLRTPQPGSGAPRARVRGRLVKRGVQLPGSCLKPAARKPTALPRPRDRARARSFLDDAAAVSGSDSGDDDDAEDGASESDLEGFVAHDEDATPLTGTAPRRPAPHALYQPSQTTPTEQFVRYVRRRLGREVEDTPGAHDRTPDEYDREDSFLADSDEEGALVGESGG